MKLIDYIRNRGGTGTIECPVLADVARKSKCSHRTLYMIALGHKVPGPKLAIAIEEATCSAVLRGDLRPDLFGVPDPARRTTAAPDRGDAAQADAIPVQPVSEAA